MTRQLTEQLTITEISELTLKQIKNCDAGIWMGEEWEGIKIPTVKEVMAQFAGRVIMNIHIYDTGDNGYVIKKLNRLINKYKIENYVYFAGNKDVLSWAQKIAPHIERACLEGQKDYSILQWAEKFKCTRVQFYTGYYTDKMITQAKNMNLICNLFYADDKKTAQFAYNTGIDTVLTNYTNKIIDIIK